MVIMTAGRFAGKKAIIIKASEEGNDSKKFGHALGIKYLIMEVNYFFFGLFNIDLLL